MEKATFAAGSFWGVEAIFQRMPGVIATRVGYTGGTTANPSYEEVCENKTGHAEAVEVRYDPAQVSYQDLLHTFWQSHNPSMLNRQGPDIGSQFRSAIFYHDEHQQEAALISRALMQQHEKFRLTPIVTEIVAAGVFYEAEAYHQQYLQKRGIAACMKL